MSLRIPRRTRDAVVVWAAGRVRPWVRVSLVVALASGCTKQAANGVTIGPNGGTVLADDPHVRLDIPPGALGAPTEIRITPTTVNRSGILPGTAYDFAPDGLVFGTPATLTMRPPSGVTLDANSRIVHVMGDAIQFDDGPSVDVSAQTVSAQLSGFSTHAVGSTVTLCPEGCPSVPTVTATPFPGPPGYIELTGSCSANGGGSTAELIVERTFFPGLGLLPPDGGVGEFASWSTYARFAAPPTNAFGGCTYQFDDQSVCELWTYAYRVRAHTLQVTTNASNTALAIGPGTLQCMPPGGDGGTPTPDAGTPDGGSGGGPGTVTVHTYQQAGSQRPAPTNAVWVGGQDGTGPFTPLSGQNGVYRLNVQDPAGRYGVAVACTAASPADAQVIQATTIEGTDLHVVCRGPAPSSTAVTVTTQGCASAAVSFGSSIGIGTPCGTSSGTIESGTHDAVGVSYAGGQFVRVLVEHDVSPPAITLDFQGPDSASPAARQVKVAPNGLWLYTLRTPATLFLYASSPGSGNYPGFPASIRGPDDIHNLCTVDVNNPRRTGYICHYFRDPVDIDDSTAPYAAIPSPVGDKTHVTWSPYLASGFDIAIASWRIWLSIGWLGQTSSYQYPRLCDVTGFPLPCVDSTTDTQYAFRAYKPAEGFAASLVDIQNAESLPSTAPDGLTYAVALANGSL